MYVDFFLCSEAYSWNHKPKYATKLMNLCRFSGGYYSISAENDFLFHMSATGKIRLDKRKTAIKQMWEKDICLGAFDFFFSCVCFVRLEDMKGKVKKKAAGVEASFKGKVIWARINDIEVVDFLKWIFSLSTIFGILLEYFSIFFSRISDAPWFIWCDREIERWSILTRIALNSHY